MKLWKPDFKRLDTVLRRRGEPDIVPFYELFADIDVMQAVTGKAATDKTVQEYYQRMGFDYSVCWLYLHFGQVENEAYDKSSLTQSKRRFVSTEKGVIENRADFEKFHWPLFDTQYSGYLDYAGGFLPDGMKLVVNARGLFEYVTFLTGLVNFSYMLYDDEKLVWDMLDKIGGQVIRMFRCCLEGCSRHKLGAFALCDDLGYDHGTMVDPKIIRKFFMPWYKEVSDVVHSYDLPLILHSCGNIKSVMDDFIDYIKIDALHSFQDKILPVTEAKKLYGGKIALLGGVDIDFLCNAGEEELKQYVGNILSECTVDGGYAFGTGNSAANYIPLKNYINMLKYARDGFEPFIDLQGGKA